MNDMEAYGDGYMEPEEEWEREGLLDPAWEKQQKKVSPLISLLFPSASLLFLSLVFYLSLWELSIRVSRRIEYRDVTRLPASIRDTCIW